MEYMVAGRLRGCSPLWAVASLPTGMDRQVEVTRTQVGLPVAPDLQEEEVPEGAPVAPDLQEEEVPEGAPGEEDLTVAGHPAPDPPGLQGEAGGGDQHILQTTMETVPMKISILKIANSLETSRRRGTPVARIGVSTSGTKSTITLG